MNFTHPNFLYAALAVGIPVIIHLFNFKRYRKIPFTNTRLIAQIEQSTKSRNQLRNLLILLARMLAVLMLVLAFAQPYLPNEHMQASDAPVPMGIYVDNSFSMSGESEQGQLLSQAINLAADLVHQLPGDQSVYLLSNDPSQQFSHPLGIDEFSSAVMDLVPCGNTRNLAAVVDQFKLNLPQTMSKGQLFMFSDFQRTLFPKTTETLSDSDIQVIAVPLQPQLENNLSIDSAWFTSPVRPRGGIDEINVRVRNHGDQDMQSIPVRLSINGVQKSLNTISVRANSYSDSTLTFRNEQTGIMHAQLEIEDRPIDFDDQFHFGYSIPPSIHALIIDQEKQGSTIQSALESEPAFDVKHLPIGRVVADSIQWADVIYLTNLTELPSGLAGHLIEFIDNGGNLAIFPSATSDGTVANRFLAGSSVSATKAVSDSGFYGQINTSSPFYQGVFETYDEQVNLPWVRTALTFNSQTTSLAEPLVEMENGELALLSTPRGSGQLYVFNAPLGEGAGNLHKHALFVPLIYKIGLLSQASGLRSFEVGTNQSLEVKTVDNYEAALEMVHLSDSSRHIPQQYQTSNGVRIGFTHQPSKAGLYALLDKNDSTLSSIGVNYSRTESDLHCIAADELAVQFEKLGLPSVTIGSPTEIREIQQSFLNNEGKPLWKWCILLTLVFLCAEIVLIKVLK